MQPTMIRATDLAQQYVHTATDSNPSLIIVFKRKRQQIDSLKGSFATVVEVIRDSLLDVPLVLRDRKTITLRVYVSEINSLS